MTGAASGSYRVKRGGSWNNNANNCTVKEAPDKCTGAIDLSTGFYWSSSQDASLGSHRAWDVLFGSGDFFDDYKDVSISVCAVRSFN